MFQQVILVGNLGADPELRYTPKGVAVCNFSLAVNERWNDRESGESREKTTWFRVAAWRELGENCATYLSKGRQVMVIGRVEEPSAWIGKDGQPRAQIEVTARDVRFLGARNGNGGAGAPHGAPGEAGQSVSAPADEDEIPF